MVLPARATGCETIIKTVDEAAEIVAHDPLPCTPDLSDYTLKSFVNKYIETIEKIFQR